MSGSVIGMGGATAGTAAGFLDDVAVREIMESYTLENRFQGKMHIDGRGYFSGYVSDTNARGVAIPHMRMPELGITREFGASVNGGGINTDNLPMIVGTENGYMEDDVYHVNLLYTFDKFFYVHQVIANMGGVRQLEEYTQKNIILARNREQTVSVLAKQLFAGVVLSLTKARDQKTAITPTVDTIAKQVFGYDRTKVGAAQVDATSAVNVFTAANGALDNGDPETFLGMVTAEERQAFARTSFKVALNQSNQVTNADAGLLQQYTGFIDPFSGEKRFMVETGMFGVVNGVLMTWVDEQLWGAVYKAYSTAKSKPSNWFGLDQTIPAHQSVIALLDKVDCLLVAARGTYHGVADSGQITVNPYANRTSGEMRIESRIRWGNAVLVPKSVKVILNSTTVWTPAEVQAIATVVTGVVAPSSAA